MEGVSRVAAAGRGEAQAGVGARALLAGHAPGHGNGVRVVGPKKIFHFHIFVMNFKIVEWLTWPAQGSSQWPVPWSQGPSPPRAA